MPRFFPGLRFNGGIITRIHRSKHERGWVYPEGVDPDSTEGSKVKPHCTHHVRMDTEPPIDNKWVIVPPFAEVYVGWWDGETIVDWAEVNGEIEGTRPKGCCLDCMAETRRWCHLAHDYVCWDCCDSRKRRKIAKAAYACPEEQP